ncbi:flagellin [Stenotrophomonas cyclobalanopsidis]|uniref:flagellin n=1 Tax=Stenotrophomonas cyclobalanopsidis TaxID=2771362 RepID=UPI002FDB829D
MAQVINTNTMSLNAQRNLSSSGSSLATTIQRLSSGSRINSAKDDAAGLAISERFGTQIRGTDVAIRNANDGISLAQVAEGSLSEIGNNLQRIRELSVQSANATNSSSDRKALQAEVTQLVSEIDRVAKQSEFNGTKLLDGSFSSQLFQIGANAGQAIAIDKVVDATTANLGSATFQSATVANAAANAADRTKISGTISVVGADDKVHAIKIDDIEFAAGTSAEDKNKALASAINAKLGETGIMAELNTDASTLTVHQVKNGGSLIATGTTPDATVAGTVKLSVQAWDDDASDWGTAAATNAVGTVTTESKHVADLDISTVAGAQKAMSLVDEALGSINSTRADLGAIQNRFTSVVANLQTSTENLSASRSRIKDTDFAKETAELTRTQILQQAGTAMLAQANQVPQNVLSLLR